MKRLADADGTCKGNYHPTSYELLSVDVKVKHQASVLGVLDTLAHELVHAKQHLRGDFSFSFIEVKIPFLPFLKFNRIVKVFKDQIMYDVDYYDQHCEQEAFNKSHQMMLEFMRNPLANPLTDSIDKCMNKKECDVQVTSDDDKKINQDYPRDFDLDFTDPHGDICETLNKDKEQE